MKRSGRESVRGENSAANKIAAAAPLFAALGDETRLRIVARLSGDGPLSIARLAQGTPVTRQAITKHLETLEAAGFARGSRSGRERVWELQPRRLAEAQGYLDRISHQWDLAIGRLRALVEEK